MAHDVFISYSNKDKPIADAICANLEGAGVRCWIAPRDIAPGEDWPTAIVRAISLSRIMVLVFSANSNSSEQVGREINLAADNKLVIIPFKIEDFEPEPGKQYYLSRTHWLDAMNPPTREQILTLVETVKKLLTPGSSNAAPATPAALKKNTISPAVPEINLVSMRVENPEVENRDTTSQWVDTAPLAELIEAIAKDLQQSGTYQFSIRLTRVPRKSPDLLPASYKYPSKFSPFHYSLKPPFDKEKTAWRLNEYPGSDRAASDFSQEWQKVDDIGEAVLVILDDNDDDTHLDFRNHPELWPKALHTKGKERPWILYKMARPLAQGQLWEHLHTGFSDRLIVVASVDDLRLSEVQISQGLSWERTAQDVFRELVQNPYVNSLSHCAHVIISFGPDGAILLSRQEGQDQPSFQCCLFFDPRVIEGMWEKDYPGGMIGYSTCLAAGLARQWLLSPEQPDISSGIQSGLSAMRILHLEGYGARGMPTSQVKLVFPIPKITSALAGPSNQFAMAQVKDPIRFIRQKGTVPEKSLTEGFWTILQDRINTGLDQVAMRIVLEGPEAALKDVPWGQFGNMLTVDRQEIESYRIIGKLVTEYAGQNRVLRPLSIAVFGTPGSVKFFGVSEITKSLLPGQISQIRFNLSLFDKTKDLLSAFQKVQEVGLSGMIPLVFWEDFDTSLGERPLGWLRYFLAPMQDGIFQQGQISHPIGRAIFVFIGGSSSSMAEFNKGTEKDFQFAKGPDFVSRLKGYINILGLNPVNTGGGDPYFIIRRAILLRLAMRRIAPHLFERHNGKEILNIEGGILRALLKIGEYKQGARSMESILTLSELAGKTAFERSCLPSESQLDLHVDGKSFLSLVQQVELEGPILEHLAEVAHEIYCEGMIAAGYHYGPKNDHQRKINSSLVPYAELPEDSKEANRLYIRDIPIKLAVAGYILIPARNTEPSFEFPGTSLEELAETEHERWMQSKLLDGWKYAPTTDRTKKMHNCLVPWKELSENVKGKDRDLVYGILKILARAGYAIKKSGVPEGDAI